MTRDELVAKLKDVEWDDFEAKEAASELPKSVWETVSAFSNASGGWIVLGVRQTGKKFEITGVKNPEKVESDFLNVVRGGQKLSQRIAVTAKKHKFRGKTVLTWEKLTHSPVEFASDLVCSTVTYRRKSKIEPVMGSSIQNDPVNGPVNLSNLSSTAAAVLNAVKAQNAASMVVIAAQLHVSPSTVKRALRQLKEAQAIERVGSDKNGHWEVK